MLTHRIEFLCERCLAATNDNPMSVLIRLIINLINTLIGLSFVAARHLSQPLIEAGVKSVVSASIETSNVDHEVQTNITDAALTSQDTIVLHDHR